MKIKARKDYYCDFCGDKILKGQRYFYNNNAGKGEHFDTGECMTAFKNEHHEYMRKLQAS